MKTSQLLLSIAMSLPALSNAQAVYGWDIEGVPEGGLKDITFPMSVKGSAHERHYYYANQFPFVGSKDVGYTGLQPQPDADGRSQIRGVFSTFIDGATTTDKLCHKGADGGPGVSCGFVFFGEYDNMYDMVISNTADTTWMGTAVDTTTGAQHHLGTFTLPPGTQGISGGNMGFVEDYVGVEKCTDMPRGGAIVLDPFSPSTAGAKGRIGEPYDSGTCVGKEANWVAKRTDEDNGWVMTLGY
ncbi:uncharacterized protein DNG_05153 [Cephalotrichum gorgonifer]|uniref:Uncharacterized protein n=1 Tax=Cephalotrichum gorgonifer TaxID=2041049 RepID=A0AAE8MXX9_9PEZI|nr:uncharacterized protein DNG_05153 [Cephalotrichum gorgonifer]